MCVALTRSNMWCKILQPFLRQPESKAIYPAGFENSAVFTRNHGRSVFLFSVSDASFAIFFCCEQNRIWKPKFFSQSLLNLAEITYGPLIFASTRDLHYPVVSSKQTNGDRKGVSSRSSSRGRIPRGNGNKGNQSSKSPEEIISLFRKIQSSVSKGSVSSKKRNSKISEAENVPSVESILEVLHQPRAEVTGTAAMKEGDNILVRQKGSPRKEEKANDSFSSSTKFTRLPSNFVRRSPIPPSNQRLKVNLRSEDLPSRNDDTKMETLDLKVEALQKVEALKLAELKELAKSRGIKGYSKLRKAELVKLLVML